MNGNTGFLLFALSLASYLLLKRDNKGDETDVHQQEFDKAAGNYMGDGRDLLKAISEDRQEFTQLKEADQVKARAAKDFYKAQNVVTSFPLPSLPAS